MHWIHPLLNIEDELELVIVGVVEPLLVKLVELLLVANPDEPNELTNPLEDEEVEAPE